MKKTTAILLSCSALLFGMVLGFLISPIKKGIEVGNNSGNSRKHDVCTVAPKCGMDAAQ